MRSLFSKKGVPIGNLTSQIFANIYMNEFDQFVKHGLKVKYYARYTDDFVIISENLNYLKELLPKLKTFLSEKLKLELHPGKIIIRKFHQGVDFLGYVIFPHHHLLRSKTKERILKNIRKKVVRYHEGFTSENQTKQSLQSYLGVLSHADAYDLAEDLKNQFWFWMKEK